MNMAIDSAILESLSGNYTGPVLRLYSWADPCVTVGYSQKIEDTVDLKHCHEDSVDIIRRITGGGTVYHDQEITYSLFISERELSLNVPDSFLRLLHPLIKTLNDLGVPAVYKSPNDILVNGKKISGNSQVRKRGILLQHGTIILSYESEIMFRYIKKKDNSVLPTSVADFIGSGHVSPNTRKEIEKRIAERYSELLRAGQYLSKLSGKELNLAALINEKIFKCLDWNEKRIKICMENVIHRM